MTKPLLLPSLIAIALNAVPAAAQPVDRAATARIVDEGLNRSQVAETAAYLADRIGGRLTNSPAMRQAEAWTQAQFTRWGLANVHKEGFAFGRGWSIESSSVRMVAPRPIQLRAIPVAWTPATAGTLTAPIVVAPMRRERDFAAWHGKLGGKIVLVTLPVPARDDDTPHFKRLDDAALGKLGSYEQPSYDPDAPDPFARRLLFARKLDAFLKAEGALAWVRMSYRADGLVTGEGYAFQTGATPALPGVEIAQEDYRRLARLAKTGPVTLAMDSRVTFHDEDSQAYDIVADIPGRDPKAGYVMAGAHLDSWVAADGAADNGAGSAMIMEAARILKALNVTPKRTIRFALWAGEEQGLLGSAAYVASHLARRPPGKDREIAALGAYFEGETFPIQPLPGYRDLAAYFNIDNGSGKLRGIYTEGNLGAAPILAEWLAPYREMGVTTIAPQPTGGTDHVFLQQIGLPAYQFIQDPLDYGSVVHHSSVDTFDHLRVADMKQGAVVLAGVLLAAANADQPLPRPPFPTQPKPTDPFAYRDPDDQ